MCPDFRQDIALLSTPTFCDLLWNIHWFLLWFLPSSLLELIEPLFLTTLLLSPDPFTMSITNQITVIPACLVYSIIIVYCTISLPFSFLRNMPLFQKVLLSSIAFFPLSRVRETVYLSSPLLCGAVISTAMAAGLALVSSILMAGKPPIGTDCRQELSRAPLLLSVRDLPVSVSSLRGERSPVASIVWCFPLLERGVVCSQLPTNLCSVRETPLSAYSLPLQGELIFVLCMGF
jgi:hypothetical protein